jgi:nucleotide-binding universal stress UspA family protein
MSNILIPVDFSLSCHNAYRYGLHLAKHFGLNVVLAHYYNGSISTNSPLIIAGDGTIRGSYIERLRHFAYSHAEGIDYPLVQPPTGVEVNYELVSTFSVSASINQRAAADDITMVVMAPRSSKTILGKWLGSTSTTVSESCSKPVFIVPNEAVFHSFDHIVVANNHSTADPYPLWQIEMLARMQKSMVHFVHVDWPGQNSQLKFSPWRLMEKLVEESPTVEYPFEVTSVENEDVTEGLIAYADEVGASLITIINNSRNRWQALLRATLTQDISLKSHIPVLVLHTQEPDTLQPNVAVETAKA